MDKRNLLWRGISNDVGQEKGGETPTMCRLSGTQPCYQKRPIPPTAHRGRLGQATNGQILHKTAHQGCIPQCQNKRRRRMENDIHHKIRHLRLLGNAFWANQCTCSIPKMDQQNLAIIYRYMLHSVPGQCPIILRRPGTTPKSRGCHHPRNTVRRNETQTIEMRISSTRNRIPRIHHQQRRSQSRPYQNSSNMGLEGTY